MPDHRESWEYWHQRGNDIYALDDMREARRCHRIATILRGDVGRQTRFLYKIARNLGEASDANRLRTWILVATGGALDLPVVIEEARTPANRPTAAPADSAGVEDRVNPSADDAGTPADTDPPLMSVPRAVAPIVLLVVVLWLAALLLVDVLDPDRQLIASTGSLVAIAVTTMVLALFAAEVIAASWLRLRARTMSMAEAALWQVPVHFEERLRRARTSRERLGLVRLDKFSRLFMPHPFAAFVRRRLRQSSVFSVRHRERPGDDDAYEIIGPQGTSGRAFPTDFAPPDGFRVLVVGGSVAEQLFSSEIEGFESPLEGALRDRLASRGLPAPEVWCGAVGGWTAVNFVPFAMAYGRRFHCIVSLFGYNEYMMRSLSSHAARVFYDSVVDDAELDLPRLRIIEAQIRERIDSLRAAASARWAGLRTVVERRLLFDLFERHARVRRQPARPNGPMAELVTESLSDATREPSLDESVRYVLALQDFCARHGIALVNCIQPLAPFRKPLTAAERSMLDRRIVERNHKFVGYDEFVRDLHAALRPETEIHDLGGVFEAVHETVYLDECHVIRDPSGVGLGSSILAAAIAETVTACVDR